MIASITQPKLKNAIGTHNGSYSVYRSIAVAAGKMDPFFRPDLHNTAPPVDIPPSPSWFDPTKMVSMDPWGHLTTSAFGSHLKDGVDVRPTIAITKAHIQMPETKEAMELGRIVPDGNILLADGSCVVTKAAVEHVWHLPGVAKRFNITEATLRRCMFEQTGGMFPELITRSDIETFLPPIGGQTIYIFGNPDYCRDESKVCTVRVHDECNGSDVFGSDICTCRPYLIHGIEECVKTAQQGGVGVIVYFRKEGRSLGEVTKFLVYNARKRQEGGDRAETYFHRTACVAGVEDMRFQELMPDSLHWLGITKIDRLISMSDMKYNAITGSGIRVLERVAIPGKLLATRNCISPHMQSRGFTEVCWLQMSSFLQTRTLKSMQKCTRAILCRMRRNRSLRTTSRRPLAANLTSSFVRQAYHIFDHEQDGPRFGSLCLPSLSDEGARGLSLQ